MAVLANPKRGFDMEVLANRSEGFDFGWLRTLAERESVFENRCVGQSGLTITKGRFPSQWWQQWCLNRVRSLVLKVAQEFFFLFS